MATDHPTHDEKLREIQEDVVSGRLREIELAFTDHQGQLLGKRIPADVFLQQGMSTGFCSAALAWDYDATILNETSLTGADSGYPDAKVKADLSTFRWLPWRQSTGLVIGTIVDEEDGEPLGVGPRHLLDKAIARLADLGFNAKIGIETEFYLLSSDGELPDVSQHAYLLTNSNTFEPFPTVLAETLRELTRFEAINAEQGPGQFEVNFANGDPLSVCDDVMRARYAIREVARRHGYRSTFMAKPFPKISGSSSHIHISLWRDDEPAFGTPTREPNDLMLNALGGLVQYLPALTLIGSPSVNSYKRFEPDAFAPVAVSWGIDNRTGAIRALTGNPSASRIELRTPAADSNPYLATAAALFAVASGVEEQMNPGPPKDGHNFSAGRPMPTCLGDAIACFDQNSTFKELLGKDLSEDLLVIARAEWNAFISTVTDWDRKRYLPVL